MSEVPTCGTSTLATFSSVHREPGTSFRAEVKQKQKQSCSSRAWHWPPALHFTGRARDQLHPPLRSVPDGQGRQAWPQTLSFAASRRFCGLGRGWALIDIWASVGLPVSMATHCEDKVRKQYQWLGWGSQLHVAVVS